MKRREFITLLSGAAWTIPNLAAAQDQQRQRRIGMLISSPKASDVAQERYRTFQLELEELGWKDGRNLQINIRWGASEPRHAMELARELLSLTPDLIVVNNPIPLEAVLQTTSSTAVLFLGITDPVEMGYVQSYAKPNRNVTGFTNFETKTAAKWLELLKAIAPGTTRVLILMRAPSRAMLSMQTIIESAAPSLGIDIVAREVLDNQSIEHEISSFATIPQSGLIVFVGSILALRDVIVEQAIRYRLPAIYPYRFYVEGGGLLSYGVDSSDIYRHGASYANRILRGERPGDLPVQEPTKYELIINRKTANALGLSIPPSLLAIADEVIE